MNIDLHGFAIFIEGQSNPIATGTQDALLADGARMVEVVSTADILLLSYPLIPEAVSVGPEELLRTARECAQAMSDRGRGRILFLISALAGIPARRHPDYSVRMAAALSSVRVLAMEFGPKVLVNAVGFGLIDRDDIVSGEMSMLSHVSLGRAGTVDEAVAAVKFFCDPLNSYTTGQMLSVDGGWTAGYGRNF